MSGFGDNFDQADVDPAAEFLAREQDELAGLEDEVKPAAITVPVVNGGTFFFWNFFGRNFVMRGEFGMTTCKVHEPFILYFYESSACHDCMLYWFVAFNVTACFKYCALSIDDPVNSVGSFELVDGIDQDGPKEPSLNGMLFSFLFTVT